MKRKIIDPLKKILFIFSITILLFSCGTKKDIVYFQDIDAVGSSKSIVNYTSVIRPDDMLTITVSSMDQDGVRPFNLQAVSFVGEGGQIGRTAQQTYLVENNGTINFPVLGSIKLAGLSRTEATTLIRDMVKVYVTDAIVNIRTVNFKVTVLGEVRNPGSFTIPNERITVIEALGLAGDINLQAERKNVLVVREEEGKQTSYRLDLTSRDVFNSPAYYLKQNDVIYVEPNTSRVKSSTVGPNVGATLNVITTLITAAAFVISVSR